MTGTNLASDSSPTGQAEAFSSSSETEAAHPYPVMLTAALFARRPVLVVGGGRVAERRVKTLLEAGAKVRLIAPHITPDLAAFVSTGEIEWLARSWQLDDVGNFPAALLIFAATDNPKINAEVETEARENGRLLNRADLPTSCDFTLPGVVRSGEITLAVSTGGYVQENSIEDKGGASPALTVHLRKRLAAAVGPEYSRFSALLREFRPKVKREISVLRRPGLWKRMVASEALELLRQQREVEARKLLDDYIREEAGEAEKENEEVY